MRRVQPPWPQVTVCPRLARPPPKFSNGSPWKLAGLPPRAFPTNGHSPHQTSRPHPIPDIYPPPDVYPHQPSFPSPSPHLPISGDSPRPPGIQDSPCLGVNPHWPPNRPNQRDPPKLSKGSPPKLGGLFPITGPIHVSGYQSPLTIPIKWGFPPPDIQSTPHDSP